MKEYLLLFRNASKPDSYMATTDDMARDMPLWQQWIGSIAGQGKLVSTAPIEYNSSIVTAAETKQGPYKEANSVLVSGYLICKSDSIAEVEGWSKTCPILRYPDSSVEVRPLVPFPVG